MEENINVPLGETLLLRLQTSPIVIWIALLFAPSAIGYGINLPSEWIVGTCAFGFIPLFLVLSLQWMPATLWKVPIFSVLLMVGVAFPVHLIAISLPGLHTLHQWVLSDHSTLAPLGRIIAAGAEEVCKIVPLLFLYRRLARCENHALAGFFIGWFSGLSFGFLEAIGISSSMAPLSEGADVRLSLNMIVGRVLYFALAHAALGGISALFIVPAFQSGRLFRQIVIGLAVATAFHAAINCFVPLRPVIALLMLLALGYGYAKIQRP